MPSIWLIQSLFQYLYETFDLFRRVVVHKTDAYNAFFGIDEKVSPFTNQHTVIKGVHDETVPWDAKWNHELHLLNSRTQV